MKTRSLLAMVPTASLFMLCPASAHAQGGVPLWTNRYDGGFYDSARAIALDKNGNVFVTGLSDTPGTDIVTIKYSNEGVTLWTNRYDGPADGEDVASAIAVDGNGNVFVTGSSWSNDHDYITIAYSNAGLPLWTNRYNELGGGSVIANAIAVDSNGNVFVTGTGPSAPAGNADYVTLAYSSSGVPLWTNRYNGPGRGDDGARAIAVDRSGNVFVTGSSPSGIGSASTDYATIKYSNAGVALWTNRYNGGFYDSANAIALDSAGNVFVTGESSATNGLPDYATIAYSNSGVPLWTNRYDGPANQGDRGTAIAVDSSGNVFVTGASVTVRDFISDPPDYATIKYSNAGVPMWTNYYNGPANMSDRPSAIAVDSGGNVFVTGASGDAPCCPASTAYATVAYSNAGEPLWENRYNGPDNLLSGPAAMAVDSNGNVFVTGDSQNSTGRSDIVTIKYSSSVPPPVHLDFQLLNNQLVLNWTNAGFSLQSAPAVTGPFTNLPAATSPYTNPLTAPRQFFRLISN
jgi:hypothetical protein